MSLKSSLNQHTPWSTDPTHKTSFTCFLFPREIRDSSEWMIRVVLSGTKNVYRRTRNPKLSLGSLCLSVLYTHLPHTFCKLSELSMSKKDNGTFCIWSLCLYSHPVFLACKFISYFLPTLLSYYVSLLSNVTFLYHTETQYCSSYLSRANYMYVNTLTAL